MRAILTSLFLYACLSSTASAALRVDVSPKIIGPHDTMTLTLSSSQTTQTAPPDLTPLETHFSILSTEHRVSYQVINGHTEVKNEWVLILYPRQTGVFTLPTLTLGTETTASTPPIRLEVSSETPPPGQHTTTAPETPELFIETTLSPVTQGFVNEQRLYTVHVYHRRPLMNIDYTPPHAKNALIVPLKQSAPHPTTWHQEMYTLETLRYAIFPTQSGALTIHPPHLKGLAYDDMLPQPVHARGKTLQMDVQPAPAHPHPFLPMQDLSLSETFEPAVSELPAGNTVTRTVTIKGAGFPASFLPIPSTQGVGYTAYATPPVLQQYEGTQQLTGIATVKITYLFNQQGTHTIPAIQMPWFNTTTRQLQRATLPAHTFNILPIPHAQTATTAPIPLPATPPATAASRDVWRLSTLILAGILIAIWLYPYAQRKLRMLRQPARPRKSRKTFSARQLKLACQQHEPAVAQRLLLAWAHLTWPDQPIQHLHQLAKHCKHPLFASELERLSQALYHHATTWQGEGLWSAFITYTKTTQKPRPTRRAKRVKPTLGHLNPR